MNDDPLADAAPRQDGNIGINNGILADANRIPHIDPRIKNNPVFNLHPVPQIDKGVNRDRFPDAAIFPNLGQGTDPQGMAG